MIKARLFLALVTLFPVMAPAQGEVSLYVTLDCTGAGPNFERHAVETRLPVYQHMVDEGRQVSWSLYRVHYGDPSRCPYYAVSVYRGTEQLNNPMDYFEAFRAAIPKPDRGQPRSQPRGVSTELWQIIDQTEIRPHRYAIVNWMHASDPVAYESMESKVFKAGHEQLIEKGFRAGWALYALVAPIGSSIPYNYGTVDFVNELGPVPMAEAMMTGNPDRDLDAMHELLDLRDQVLSETWALVAATTPRDED